MLPDAQFLITSGTGTSPKLVRSDLPRAACTSSPRLTPGPAFKRFCPLGAPMPRFCAKARFGPRDAAAGPRRPGARWLVNARMSDKTVDFSGEMASHSR